MAEEFLDRADVGSGLEEVGGEGVSEGVTAGLFRDPGFEDGSADGALEDGGVEVMAMALAGFTVCVDPGGGEDPLPGPFATGTRVFPGEGVGEGGMACARAEVPLVLLADAFEMGGQIVAKAIGEEGDAVLVALAGSDDDVAGLEVDVLDAKASAFQQAEAGPVEKSGHESVGALQSVEQGADLPHAEDDREGPGNPGPDEVVEGAEFLFEDFPVEKDQGAEGLILGRGADLPFAGEHRKELGDLGRAHLARVPAIVKEDESNDPSPIRRFRAGAPMT